MESKQDVRDAIKERLSQMSAKDRDIESRVTAKELRKYLRDEPHTIGAYYPLSDEPNIVPLLQDFLDEGWLIALPAEQDGKLVFRTVHDFSVLKKGRIGVLEPPQSETETAPTDLATILVPGRAFDRNGNRLGRGSGGYDFWIEEQRAKNPTTQYIGVCFENQVLPTLPVEGHDQMVDAVATSRGVTSCK